MRDLKSLSLMDAIRKISLMPAQRLESLAPAFKQKGRGSVGADADLMIFNPNVIVDRATYQKPTESPNGMTHVFVNGIPVVKNGSAQEGVSPGTGIRSLGA